MSRSNLLFIIIPHSLKLINKEEWQLDPLLMLVEREVKA